MLFAFLFASWLPLKRQPASQASYSCSSYIVMERHSYQVLEGSNIHLQRSVASISKIMTAIVALESGQTFDIVEVEAAATKQEGSSLYLKEGDTLTVLDLVFGLLLRSGNDAAFQLASYLGPGVDGFVVKMNEKARALGMNDTTFNNPSGLDVDDAGNISSAYDIAKLFSYCMKNELFAKVSGRKVYQSAYGSTWHNKNRLLNSYDKCDGGKTGYTTKAKRTLVTGAKDGETELAVVTLNCGGDFAFHRELFEKHFARYAYVPFLRPGLNIIGDQSVVSKENCGLVLEKDRVLGGTMLYQFDEEGQLLKMYFVTRDNDYIQVEKGGVA